MSVVRHIVVGTAGHVDHGKTTLVQALTGTDCDRLPEEKARGITIELGFARWDVSESIGASIIDVPGHERFVGTMVAGASGIDCVLLVVAADDGVMPQTREHLAICALLGVTNGVIALTKADLADEDLLALVEADIRASTANTFLAGAEIVRCSARERTGLQELGRAVQRVCTLDERRRHGPAFLAIDRVFTRPGAGTVVTGTLARGCIKVDDELEALQSRTNGQSTNPSTGQSTTTLRVRGMQVHGQQASEARAATRLALNLRGDGSDALHRGDVIVTPASVVPTTSVHAWLELLADAPPMKRRTHARLHVGTSAVGVTGVLLDRDRLEPGERGIVRFTSHAPFATFTGQRFVVRRPEITKSPTIGGGVITDPQPLRLRRARRDKRPLFFLATSPRERVQAIVTEARYAGISTQEITRRCPIEDDIATCVRELIDAHTIIQADGRLFDITIVDEAKTKLAMLVKEIHAAKPLLRGVSGAELTTRCQERLQAVARIALADLVAKGAVLVEDGLHRLKDAGADASLLDRERMLERVAARFRSAGLTPPLDDLVRTEVDLSVPVFRDALAELRRTGALRLLGGLHFDTAALTTLRAEVVRWFTTHKTLTPGDFKTLCGDITRKHAIPLLEWLDQERVTVRAGDARIALRA